MNKHSDIVDVTLVKEKIILSDEIISKLNAKVGDKISIGYINKNGNLIPVISLSEEGNKLTKSNSFIFKGKKAEILSQLGSRFWITEQHDNLIELEGDGIPVYTDNKKAVKAFVTKEIIEDTNFNITKLNNYEF